MLREYVVECRVTLETPSRIPPARIEEVVHKCLAGVKPPANGLWSLEKRKGVTVEELECEVVDEQRETERGWEMVA